MIERIYAAYPPKEHAVCITALSHPVFHVFDPLSLVSNGTTERLPSTYRLGPEKEDRELTVHNKTGQPIHLVAIDCCLLASDDPSRCDCALVQEEIIQFVEFKHGKYARRTERIKDCIRQLANSINDFYMRAFYHLNRLFWLLPAWDLQRNCHRALLRWKLIRRDLTCW